MDFTPLKNCLDHIQEEYKVPGFDCVVYKEHEVLFRYFAGMQDKENKIPMKGDELYFIFSMTKLVTVVSALQLFEKGKIGLDDRVSDYIPEFENLKVKTPEGTEANRSDTGSFSIIVWNGFTHALPYQNVSNESKH